MNREQAEAGRSLRILVLAPVGRDDEVLAEALAPAGIDARPCISMADLCGCLLEGAGGAVIAGEALADPDRVLLERALADQPEWSDFPIIIMETTRGWRHPSAALVRMASWSYAIVLVRPVHIQTLIMAVRAALRSRSRQYQVRDELAERRRAEGALRESSERKDEFLAMLGHELRNPLAAIRNATQLIEIAAAADERMRVAHGVLDRQSLQMTRLIDGLLEVSRISRGKIRLDPETLDLRRLVEATLEDWAPRIEARGLELIRDLPPRSFWAVADRSRLAQVFDNLVGNALKFTDAPGRITVMLREQAGDAVVRILDTGVGIRAEMLERVFDPFQQDTQDIARDAGGLGLGLALARGLVELHGGGIRASSDGPGTGALFEVRLPLGAPPNAEGPSGRACRSVSRRVVIVEDNTDAGQSLRALLEAFGHRATVVESAPAALEYLHGEGAEIVLCDLGLPGQSGYDLARTIRDDPVLREVPLIAVTGYGQPEDRKRTAEAGFDGHLTKPVEIGALHEVLDRLGAPCPRP